MKTFTTSFPTWFEHLENFGFVVVPAQLVDSFRKYCAYNGIKFNVGKFLVTGLSSYAQVLYK